MRFWTPSLIIVVALAGTAFAGPYGKRPSGPPMPPSKAPGSMPRIPNLHGQPPSRVALPPDYLLLQADLGERIEAALAAEFEAYGILQSAYEGTDEAERRLIEATDALHDAYDVEDYLGDPMGENVPEAEAYHSHAEAVVDYEQSLLVDALNAFHDAQEEREGLEGLAEAGPGMADLLGPTAQGTTPDIAETPETPSSPGPAVASPPELAPMDSPEAKAERAASDEFRQALSDFADGNATLAEVEQAHSDLTDARQAAGWF
ncbi:MAG: hypothetical protein JRH10_20135 [Deltaproteobacteria bacterium]|nr:hypothetical protein [Deltaproteobacteria bacterium]